MPRIIEKEEGKIKRTPLSYSYLHFRGGEIEEGEEEGRRGGGRSFLNPSPHSLLGLGVI